MPRSARPDDCAPPPPDREPSRLAARGPGGKSVQTSAMPARSTRCDQGPVAVRAPDRTGPVASRTGAWHASRTALPACPEVFQRGYRTVWLIESYSGDKPLCRAGQARCPSYLQLHRSGWSQAGGAPHRFGRHPPPVFPESLWRPVPRENHPPVITASPSSESTPPTVEQ